MKLKRPFYQLLFVTILLIPIFLLGQAFDRPESAAYDAASDRYLVSNTGNGDIIFVPRLNPGNISIFITGQMSSVRGIIIVDNTLWTACTSNNGTSQMLYGYDLNTGVRISGSIWIVEGNFINDVTAGENDIVYLSDNNNVYWINTVSGAYGTLLANAGANGLLFDAANNRLLFTGDRPATGSAISAIDIATNTVTTSKFSQPI